MNLCRQSVAYNESKVCSLSNPVDPASGAKRQIETDIEFVVAGTRVALDRILFTESLSTTFASEFGYGWAAEPWGRAVRFRPNSTSPQLVELWRNGKTIPLVNAGAGVWQSNPYLGLELINTAGGWLLADQAEGSLELYDSSGRLASLQRHNGLSFNLSYSAGVLTSVTSSIGSLFSLSYAQGKVAALLDSGGRLVNFAFDPLNTDLLNAVTFPDQRSRAYLYEPERAPLMTIPSEAALLTQLSTADYLPQSLYTGSNTLIAVAQKISGRVSRLPVTGIIDELGNRFATYSYDAQGRAISSEHAGAVKRYQFAYSIAYSQTVVTDPFGTQRTYNFTKTAETLRKTTQSQPAGSGCGPSSSAITHDANANVSSRTDFNNQKTCYVYDLSRNLETKRVEGVNGGANCGSELSAPSSGARIIITAWHPDWRLETKIAEPKKLTTITYNGQGATCAPSTVLVDGKPPAVICTRTEQATTMRLIGCSR